jgi:hypothetical protein
MQVALLVAHQHSMLVVAVVVLVQLVQRAVEQQLAVAVEMVYLHLFQAHQLITLVVVAVAVMVPITQLLLIHLVVGVVVVCKVLQRLELSTEAAAAVVVMTVKRA